MSTIEKQLKNSKLDPFLKKIKKISLSFSKVKDAPVIPKTQQESVFTVFPLIKSPLIQPMFKKMLESGNQYTPEEELSRIAKFAITNNHPEIIYELIDLKVNLNQKIDHLKSETMLAGIVQYQHYHELFIKLIEAGAQTYCDVTPDSKIFRSNVLDVSVTYDEFLNISYLIKHNHCSTQQALQACYKQNKFHMIQYFLENSALIELELFKKFILENPSPHKQKLLDIIEEIDFVS